MNRLESLMNGTSSNHSSTKKIYGTQIKDLLAPKLAEPNPLAKYLLSSYYQFFQKLWNIVEPAPLADNWHVQYLCDLVQDVIMQVVEQRPAKDTIINVPPGESKSSIAIKFAIPFAYAVAPWLRIIVATNSSDLAKDHIDKAKMVMKSEIYRELFPHVQIRKDYDNKTGIGTTKGGFLYVATPKSGIIGKHAHLILIDDPLTREQAMSDTERPNINSWVTSTLTTRVTDVKTSSKMLIMQRLHEDDTTAVCLNKWEGVQHICLPSDDRYKVVPDSLIEHYTQDGTVKVMNPLRKPYNTILKLEKTFKDPSEASGQLGQDPQPSEGNIIKKAWFEQRYNLEKFEKPRRTDHFSKHYRMVVDGAYTKNKKNSATAGLSFLVHDNNLYLRNFFFVHQESPQAKRTIEAFYDRSECDLCSIEPKGPGKAWVSDLRSTTKMNVTEDKLPEGVNTQPSKIMRVHNNTGFMEGMRIYLNEDVDWSFFISQLTVFPNGSHDDLVDCLNMAIEKVSRANIYEDIDPEDFWG